MALQCGVSSAPSSRHAVILYIDDPAAPDNQYLGDGFTVEQSLSALGPWAPAAITADSATDCVGDTSGNTIFVGGSAAGLAAIFQITALNPGTQYFFRVTHTVSGPPANNPTGQVIICDITTFALPVLNGCVLGGPPGQTTYPGRIGTASGFVNTQPGCDQDTIQWEIATVSGGPYTPDGPVAPVNGGSPSHTFTGLTPGTTYFYRAHLNNPTDGPNFVTTSECSFTTLAATAVSCSPATAITQVSATLNGGGDSVATNQFLRLVWGTTSGGPYPNSSPNVAGTNVSGQTISENIAGLTPGTNYFYAVQRLDADGTTVLDTSSECSFTTDAVVPPTPTVACSPASAVTQTGATLNGTGGNIPANQFVRFAWGTTLGGPYPNTTPNVAGTNVAAQAVSAPIAGLAASTPYFYVVQHLDTDGTTVLTTSTGCTFTTSTNGGGVYAPRTLIDPPLVQPYRFGLASVATVIDHPGDSKELNGVTFKSLACSANLAEFVAVCPPSDNPEKVATDGNRTIITTDPAFELYANLSCKETTLEAMFREAETIFALAEPKALENKVWDVVLATPEATILNTVAGAAGALSVTAGIAALESFMGDCYPGRAVFHSDRGTVPYAVADHQLIVVGGQISTFLGSGWAAYSGSPNTGPDGTPAPDGHAWLYATSQPVIHRWPAETRPLNVGYILKKNADGGQTNEPQVIVERSYLAYTECCVGAVLVCLGACE